MITATYTVKGMTCGHCVQAVTDEISRLPDVTSVDVDLATGRVTVRSDQPVPDSGIRDAVEDAGYELAA